MSRVISLEGELYVSSVINVSLKKRPGFKYVGIYAASTTGKILRLFSKYCVQRPTCDLVIVKFV